VIAHLGALPLEEVLPLLAGAGSALLAVRAFFHQLLARAPKSRDEDALLRGEGGWWWRRHDEDGNGHD
jgi:hypothetical protein